MGRVFATASDYEGSDWEGSPTADLTASLRRASRAVESLTMTAIYETNDEGYPVDVDIAEALRDATCAQAAYWAETGDASGSNLSAGSMSLGSLSLGGTRSAGDVGLEGKIAARYAPETIEILANAGLRPIGVRS